MNQNRPVQSQTNRLTGRQGFGTLEVVIIIAVLLSVAMIFRSALMDYAQNLIQTVFNEENVLEELTSDQPVE